MKFDATFFKIASVCAIISSITTFLLWFLPFGYSQPSNLDERIALHTNPFYMGRLWVNFAHIYFALIAYWAVVAKKSSESAGFVSLGFIFFLIWGITELMGVSVLIFALNYEWRKTLASQPDEAARTMLLTNINAFNDVWNALFFLLLIAFLLGTLFYGLALWKGKGLERILSICFLLAVPLTLFIIADGYGGLTWFSLLVTWIYPALQPISRFLLGVWLWKNS